MVPQLRWCDRRRGEEDLWASVRHGTTIWFDRCVKSTKKEKVNTEASGYAMYCVNVFKQRRKLEVNSLNILKYFTTGCVATRHSVTNHQWLLNSNWQSWLNSLSNFHGKFQTLRQLWSMQKSESRRLKMRWRCLRKENYRWKNGYTVKLRRNWKTQTKWKSLKSRQIRVPGTGLEPAQPCGH